MIHVDCEVIEVISYRFLCFRILLHCSVSLCLLLHCGVSLCSKFICTTRSVECTMHHAQCCVCSPKPLEVFFWLIACSQQEWHESDLGIPSAVIFRTSNSCAMVKIGKSVISLPEKPSKHRQEFIPFWWRTIIQNSTWRLWRSLRLAIITKLWVTRT